MLNFGYQAFIAIIDVLFIEVVTITKFGVNWSKIERTASVFQDGGSRHVDFRLRGALRCNCCVDYRSRYIHAGVLKFNR